MTGPEIHIPASIARPGHALRSARQPPPPSCGLRAGPDDVPGRVRGRGAGSVAGAARSTRPGPRARPWYCRPSSSLRLQEMERSLRLISTGPADVSRPEARRRLPRAGGSPPRRRSLTVLTPGAGKPCRWRWRGRSPRSRACCFWSGRRPSTWPGSQPGRCSRRLCSPWCWPAGRPETRGRCPAPGPRPSAPPPPGGYAGRRTASSWPRN